MSDSDLFGLVREKKILESGVRNVFTPHHPVKAVDLLFGRQEEARKIIETFNKPGQSVLLYGERGVGKSSIASVIPLIANKINPVEKIIWKACTSEDTFDSIFSALFIEIGIDRPSSKVKTTGRKLRAQAKAIFAEGGGESEYSEQHKYEFKNITPSDVVNYLKNKKIIYVIDEVDSLQDIRDKHKLAEVIKLVSDLAINFKIMVVGISETGFDLFAGHPSVQRCLRPIPLPRMSERELTEIVIGASKKIGIEFDDKLVKKIVNLSDGFPHFTHLLALKCAEEAVSCDSKKVTNAIFNNAQNSAADESESTLKKQYSDAIRSQTEMYRLILLASARCASRQDREFKSEDLRVEYKKLTSKEINQGELNNYLPKLISDNGKSILKRLAKGVYCFNDPRMPSFIRIINHEQDL